MPHIGRPISDILNVVSYHLALFVGHHVRRSGPKHQLPKEFPVLTENTHETSLWLEMLLTSEKTIALDYLA